jgi:hypothetical protein
VEDGSTEPAATNETNGDRRPGERMRFEDSWTWALIVVEPPLAELVVADGVTGSEGAGGGGRMRP